MVSTWVAGLDVLAEDALHLAGHHYQAQNIEQIVAWLLDLDMLGGFHFNDRRYADDDLTLGSIDPYQVFRIFHEIHFFERETGAPAASAAEPVSKPSVSLIGCVPLELVAVPVAVTVTTADTLEDAPLWGRATRMAALDSFVGPKC